MVAGELKCLGQAVSHAEAETGGSVIAAAAVVKDGGTAPGD